MASPKFGPWRRGIDMLTEDSKMKPDVAREALNGDFDKDGNFTSRRGLALALASAGLHSPWTSKLGLGTFACQHDQLCRVTRSGNTVAVAPIFTLGSDAPVSFDELNNRVVFTNRDTLGQIESDGSARLLGGPDASAPRAEVITDGGLWEGPAIVAMSYLNAYGEEGGLSNLVPVNVPAGGGIRLHLPAAPPDAVVARFYRTNKAGQLRWAADGPANIDTYLIGTGKLGELATTQNLRRMPGGDIVRVGNGKLLIARGRYLYLSQAFNYGLYDPRTDHATFPRKISIMETMDDGIFIGQRGDTVLWLAGADHLNAEPKATGASAPMPGTSRIIEGSLLDPSLQINSSRVAVWLAENGYVLGLPAGNVVEPQSKRIRLPVAVAGSLAVLDRRLLSVVN